MIKTAIFDYDGVIKKSQKLSSDIIDLYKISIEEYEKFSPQLKPIIEKLDKGFIDGGKFWMDLSDAMNKPMPEKCEEKAKKMYKNNFIFFSEVIELIKKLKSEGFRLSILSNMFPYQAEIIKEMGGRSLFDDIFFSCEKGLKKPDLGFYELIVKEINIKPEECLFIDDKEENLLPAKKLGMKTILAKNQEQIVKDVWAIIRSENEI
jgi:putative hydrolase of the HAD superfamily